MKSIKREWLIYIGIIVLQILVFVYWANHKVNYHVDELYSMGYASNFTGYGNTGQYITSDNTEFELNKWIKCETLKAHLIVSPEESILNLPFPEILYRVGTARNYIMLLNLAETLAGYGRVSAVPSLALNMCIYIIACFSLISLMIKLKINEYIRYMAIAMFGFSAYIISTVLYVRFYMLVIMLMLVMLNVLYQLWIADSWNKVIGYEMTALVLCFLCYKNSEITIPFFGAFMGFLLIAAIYRRKIKQLLLNMGVFVIGSVFVLIQPKYREILFNWQDYVKSSSVYVAASASLTNPNINTIRLYTGWLIGVFKTQFFSDRYMIYYVLLVLIAVALMIFKEKPQITKVRLSDDVIYILIVLGEAIVLALFEILCEFGIWRYYCFVVTSACILFWFLIDRILKIACIQKYNRVLVAALAVFVFINALIPFASRRIENIYEEEKPFMENIRKYTGSDVVLITSSDGDNISRHEIYDCVNLVPGDRNIYFTDAIGFNTDKMDCPDEIMIWTHADRNIESVLEDMSVHGYDTLELGQDHCSKAYLCRLSQ